MVFEEGKYYHLYKRSNNNEVVFRQDENYHFFIQQYQKYLSEYVTTFSYCLMPTHFHILLRVKSENKNINGAIGIWLSAYTKAINKRYNRHGSLFQPHTKLKLIDDENYLITLITYIHQNPIRAGLVKQFKDWPHSSYLQYVKMFESDLIDLSLLSLYFKSSEEYEKYANEILTDIRKNYWV